MSHTKRMRARTNGLKPAFLNLSMLVSAPKAVIAIEIDHDLVPIIAETMAEFDNFYLVQGDALQMDLDQLILDTLGAPHRCKVVANLPYYITTPIIMGLFESGTPLQSITIMVQKEVLEEFTV